MKKRKILQKIGTMLCAVALALAPLATASAADNNLPEAGHAGSVTVHKYLRNTQSTTPGTGEELSSSDLVGFGTKAGAGIEFTLSFITCDVDEDTTVDDVLSYLGTSITYATDANGEITWDNATDGIVTGYYLLVEEAATTPDGYTPMEPAIIAVPYALGDNAWNYDIHVYPKNINEKELQKDIVDKELGYSVGDEITWKFSSIVQTSKIYAYDEATGTEAYGTYTITDVLDSRLTYTGTTSVTGTGGRSDVALDVDDDYTITKETDSDGIVALIWELTETGIKKLAEVGANTLEIEFTTDINERAYTAGTTEIDNGGILDWDGGDASSDSSSYTIEDDDKPVADLYNIEIIKTDSKGSYLAGAAFKIALSKQDAIDEKFLQNEDGTDATVTTNENGYAMFAGLPVDTTADTDFWLVEDSAPEGYVRIDTPIKVTIKNITGTTDALKLSAEITIINYKPGDPDIPSKWNLPLTGGIGTTIFYVVGAVLMFGAVVLYVRSKKIKATR